MDPAYYAEITRELRSVLSLLDDRLSEEAVALISEFIDANELGLALEQMADVLCEGGHPVSDGERGIMLALVDRMGMDMDQRVSRALAFSPRR